MRELNRKQKQLLDEYMQKQELEYLSDGRRKLGLVRQPYPEGSFFVKFEELPFALTDKIEEINLFENLNSHVENYLSEGSSCYAHGGKFANGVCKRLDEK